MSAFAILTIFLPTVFAFFWLRVRNVDAERGSFPVRAP